MVKRVLAKDESGVRFSLSALAREKDDYIGRPFLFTKTVDKTVDMWIKDS